MSSVPGLERLLKMTHFVISIVSVCLLEIFKRHRQSSYLKFMFELKLK